MTVFPAASAAGTLKPAIMSGEFNGRMHATTPSGSSQVYCSWLSPAGRVVPFTSPAMPEKYRNSATRVATSGRAWVRSAFPVSRAVSRAKCSARPSISLAIRAKARARSVDLYQSRRRNPPNHTAAMGGVGNLAPLPRGRVHPLPADPHGLTGSGVGQIRIGGAVEECGVGRATVPVSSKSLTDRKVWRIEKFGGSSSSSGL